MTPWAESVRFNLAMGGTPVTLQTYTYPSNNETDLSTLQVQDAFDSASIPTATIVDGYGRVSQTIQAGVSAENEL